MPEQQTFSAVNPANGQSIATYRESLTGDVDVAAEGALAAFDAELPPLWQADLLEKIAERIDSLGDALLEVAEAESALPRARLTGERGRTTGQLKLFASHVRQGGWLDATIDTADATRKPAAKPDLRRMNIPRGPVAVFGASNFPLAFGSLGGDTASALAAGNPVIVKGHPSHPGTSALLATAVVSALEQLRLPQGLFSLVQGTSHELSGYLVQHPAIAAVGFTGSQRAGRALFNLAAARPRPIPVFAEMGSLNPLIVLPGAMSERMDAIAQGLASSILLGAGQFCTKPGVVFVVGSAGEFIAALSRHLSAAQPFTMLNQNLRNSFCTRTSTFSKLSGVRTHFTSEPSAHAGISAMLFETTAEHFVMQRELHEEAFGPAAMVVTCSDVEQAIACSRVLGGSLTATVHSGGGDSPATIRQIVHALEPLAGRIIVNGFPTGVEVTAAMVHGGPYPATTEANSTSVGTAAIRRFTRMIAYQDMPDAVLPKALQNANPLHIPRLINGRLTTDAITA